MEMDSYSCAIQLELGLNVRRKRNVFRLRLNRARELQHEVQVGILTSVSSRKRGAISGCPLPEPTDFQTLRVQLDRQLI